MQEFFKLSKISLIGRSVEIRLKICKSTLLQWFGLHRSALVFLFGAETNHLCLAYKLISYVYSSEYSKKKCVSLVGQKVARVKWNQANCRVYNSRL